MIETWAKAHDLKLFTSFAGEERRFCYTSSARGECFQISIESPSSERVRIYVSAVEALDDAQMEKEWTSALSDLRSTLDVAFAYVLE